MEKNLESDRLKLRDIFSFGKKLNPTINFIIIYGK